MRVFVVRKGEAGGAGQRRLRCVGQRNHVNGDVDIEVALVLRDSVL